MNNEILYNDAVNLLCGMIKIPSISREESDTADLIELFFKNLSIPTNRDGNNVWTYNKYFDASKPTILLNTHHDTVRPSVAYTRDPFAPTIENGVLYGLGSNDAGASVVSLIAAFRYFYDKQDLLYNICLTVTAEEEITGDKGLESILPLVGEMCFAIVGEPTKMDLAIAEKGLLVLDCIAHGVSGHAAREEGVNAIYEAIKCIDWFKTYKFEKVSSLFGDIKMSVTIINAGSQHNVVPSECRFTVDVRVTDVYSIQQVIDIIKSHVSCDVVPRSTGLKPSSISLDHPFIKKGIELGLRTFGSPTTSDQVKLNVPSVKIGVGDSARSHSADEYIILDEIRNGIDIYIKLLDKIVNEK